MLALSYGMTMELATRKITSRLYATETKVAKTDWQATQLVDGEAYCWDAGAPGSDDWRYQHTVRPLEDGNAQPGDTRVVFIFRATKPEHRCEYRSSRAPYNMVASGEVRIWR